MHVQSVNLHDFENIQERQKDPEKLHKKEMATQSINDSQDREKIRKIFDQFMTKFDTANHPPELVHVASGKINSNKNVNIEEAASLGILQLKYFCKKLPTGFHGMVVAVVKVKMMLSGKKGMKTGDIEKSDMKVIC